MATQFRLERNWTAESRPKGAGQERPASQNVPGFTKNDRLGVSTFGSFLLHMVIILGVTFTASKLRELQGLPTLEITLVQTQSENAPDNVEFLAQANQDGGGEGESADIARNPLPVREISETNRYFPTTQPIPQPKVASTREITDLLTQRADKKIKLKEPKPDKKDLQTQPQRLGLIERTQTQQERARLNAEISRFWQEYQQRPKRKFLNARTREYKYAAYMDAWRAKIERIGNLNYPEEARRRRISGNLMLDVALNPDGSVRTVAVRRSSGHKLLDDAAIRIVELAAPFAPFPSAIRAETDILHITRTWKFNETMFSSEK
ncbi:MAG: energy transducer TonB [Gammaproteobacteria bacterium]|nr:MAG: energy transducer TonB [Gammaproteobacteria bacterium]